MPFDGKQGRRESIFGVALLAVGHPVLCNKLFPVVVRMAVGAPVMPQCRGVPVFVTGGAGHGRMFPLQCESGGRMVKVTGVPDLVEGNFRMTFGTVLSEPVFMYIPVTGGAIAMCHTPEYLKFTAIADFGFVASGTLHLPVFTFKRKYRVVVAEAGGGTEPVEIMAGGTCHTQRSLVDIRMAGEAFLFEPQVGAGPFFQLCIGDELLFVALAAVDLPVFPLQFVPGKRMVEVVLLKADHLEIPSVVIVVAGGTFFAIDFAGCMVAPSGIDPRIDLGVAGEALFVGYLLPEHMAFSAVGDSFQVFVGLCQVTRGELGGKRQGVKQQTKEYRRKGPQDHGFPFVHFAPQCQAGRHQLCFRTASPNFLVICMPILFRNWVGSSPPAKMYTRSFLIR